MHSINHKFITRIVGQMCLIEALMMVITTLVGIYYGDELLPYFTATFVYLLIGSLLLTRGRYAANTKVGRREGMLTVTLTWLTLSLLGTVPMLMSGATDDFMSALTETISGFTTTGATVFDEVEQLPHALLFWRSLMQWQGGIGIVVVTLALLPIFGGGASQIYNAETTGITHDRFLPRIKDVARRLMIVYAAETLLLILLLWLGPMGLFDAICHALSCISTGGYSTRNEGISSFDSAYVEYVLSGFMFLGGLNIALIFFALTGKPRQLFQDEEFRWFSALMLGASLATAFWLWHEGVYASIEETFRKALFQVVSLGTSTGFLTADITSWKPFFWMLALLVMFVNGCAGSTSGGLKVSRFVVLLKNLYNEFKKQVQPHLLTPVLLNGKQLSISVVHQILAFCVLYILLLFAGAMLLMLDGNNFISGISISCSALSNSGPGIGEYMSNIGEASDFSKGMMCFLMLAGRLEVFTVIGIFSPHFWRR
ncbi:TrkH family potassium uptake protein [Porphyromonas sp. COT-239 OH1446]|uniref:TrkH family potassium uptake protein n=1 Tax=Porphyromonas sp. COT-239 OH1446 TaxID=1515613 RepID=UPI00052D7E23|nr:TrkH family potassium uptake protein [Porphyromonas sp. COT-239 OH1446]KGN71282.1 potassium transporter [Porphyromonas sp. COT-239 OH1446]